MTTYDHITTLLLADHFKSFISVIINMGTNSPEALSKMLLMLPDSPYYKPVKNKPYKPLYDKHILYGIFGGNAWSTPVSDEEAIERLAERCAREYSTGGASPHICHAAPPPIDSALFNSLRNLYQNHAAQAIAFLLSRATNEVLREFCNAFLDPEELATRAQVDIIVRRIESDGMMTGNLGRYLIYTKKGDDEERLLKFKHQPSCAYLLMYLIDRKQKKGTLTPIAVHENAKEFAHLYHQVYDISDEALSHRLENLEYRKDRQGYFRAGRLKEVIYDIRLRLQERFALYDESFFPYAMTANSHLAVSPKMIHFVGEAEELAEQFRFKNIHWR